MRLMRLDDKSIGKNLALVINTQNGKTLYTMTLWLNKFCKLVLRFVDI